MQQWAVSVSSCSPMQQCAPSSPNEWANNYPVEASSQRRWDLSCLLITWSAFYTWIGSRLFPAALTQNSQRQLYVASSTWQLAWDYVRCDGDGCGLHNDDRRSESVARWQHVQWLWWLLYYTSCVFFDLFQVQFEAFNMYCIMQIVISSIPRKS